MLNRAQDKELAKSYLSKNSNLSGMIGMQLLASAIQGIVVPSILAAPTAFVAFRIFKLASTILRRASVLFFFRAFLLILLIIAFALLTGMVAAPFSAAISRYYLSIKKNNSRPRATTVFEAFDFFVHFALVGGACIFTIAWLPLAINLAAFVVFVVIILMASSLSGYIVALVLYTIAALASAILLIYNSAKFWPYVMLQADHPEMDASAVISTCKQMTNGHIWDLIVFKLSFIGWNLLGAVTLGLANVLYVTPYFNMTSVIVYEELKGHSIDLTDIPQDKPIAIRSVTHHVPAATAPAAAARLEGVTGMYAGSSFPLMPDKPVILGRDGTVAQIVFSQGAEKISRRHCEVVFDTRLNKYRVTDFSSNGTYVGTNRLPQNSTVVLERGTSISLGNNSNTIRLV